MRKYWHVVVLVWLTVALYGCQAGPAEPQRIGAMVLEIEQALSHPEDPQALATIVRHGTDSRYYVMIRGWLRQELAGVESQLASLRDVERRRHLAMRADFLRLAIRRIDLE
ncbi:hypothetical protein [Marinobacter sp. SS21]|uniref:hypothetical protein n=1 Tax=Marinobacter sp. SS21 TaxID=2979460 RepID=UPI00232C76C0|nr:hypothetical protein [Marinobacter sp. SS21]MDC0661544.1 hypothetical protein [Marinobacter sp. SS21]